ncbi:hypothetical protein CBS101457_001357 [Exobasidium rhododendri]|nr:hypothetical protein CBS101457_001357 [Exobasidium rhododendri]
MVGHTEYAIPIPDRKRPTDWIRTLSFALYFNYVIIATNCAQFVALALLYPLQATRPYYETSISYTKLIFGRLIITLSQLFAPTKLIVSCSDEDGKYLDPEKFVRRNSKGRIVEVLLPERSIWISNHQVYTDWLYIWCLAYYANLADAICIILKNGLEWIPFVGWGMQFYRFIFLKRNWQSDKKLLAGHLAYMASFGRASLDSPPLQSSTTSIRGAAKKLLLLIYPEGTLVSVQTRPTSKKFADKEGIPDCTNLLLPRSTGLLFCLRSLAADVSDLKLVDFTIGYPGIPPAGYGQTWYTLRSTFMQGVAPPGVHIHFSILSINNPNSDASPPLGQNLPESAAAAALDSQDSSEEEKTKFHNWLLRRWRQKDERLNQFYKNGDFVEGDTKQADHTSSNSEGFRRFVEIPVQLKSHVEFLDVLLYGAPIIIPYFIYRLCQ